MTTKVLWLAKGLGRGGAEQLLVTSAPHLDRERFTVEVAYLLPWKDALVPKLESAGLRVHCLSQRSAMDLRWVLRLRALLKRSDYDIVHTHMPLPAVAARLVSPRRPGHRSRIVHTEHNVWQRYRVGTRVANAVTYRRNDAVIAVSQAVSDSVSPRWSGHNVIEVLHHGVEHGGMHRGSDAKRVARDALGLPEDVFVVGTVGNFTPKKDQATLLRAFAQLLTGRPEARLVVIGSGPLQGDLTLLAVELGIRASVLFAGMRDDVPVLLPALDVFCLSSLHEGLSIALVEAMASGIPGVCTAVGGVPEVITSRVDGLLVPPSSPTALARALEQLAADEPLRNRLATAALATSRKFDIGRAVLRIEDIYDELLAQA